MFDDMNENEKCTLLPPFCQIFFSCFFFLPHFGKFNHATIYYHHLRTIDANPNQRNQNTTHENQKCRLKNCLCLPNTINYHQSSFYVTTYYNILTNWNKNLRSVYSTKIESIKIKYLRPI